MEQIRRLNGRAFTEDNDTDGNLGVKKIIWNVAHDSITVSNGGGIGYTIFDFSDGRYISAGSGAQLASASSDDGVNATIASNVADSAFYNSEGKAYKTITVSEGVTSIGSSGFRNCKAETINLPSSLTTIGSKAFMSCSANLGTLDLRNVDIGESAFSGTSITQCTVKASQINASLVKGANITDLYIDYSTPATLSGYRYNEGSVTNVYFSGSAEDWTTFMNGCEGSNGGLANANISYNVTMP